jgi:aryl-alcohol dehydrogenase-like predicted oxidoreductase
MYLTTNQRVVLQALKDYGSADDVTLAVYVHQMGESDMSSSGVRSRRAELVRKGLVEVVGVRKMRSGKSAAVHAITAKARNTVLRKAVA